MKDEKIENIMNNIIHYATLAPSGHNTQPWTYSVNNNIVRIYPDFSKRLPIVDPDDHALYISLGCALENLVIAANYNGYSTSVEYFSTDEKEECIKIELCRETVRFDFDLFTSISKRQSTRCPYNGQAIPEKDLESLSKISKQDDVSFVVFDKDDEIEPIIEFVREATMIQFGNKLFVNELIDWIRFSKKKTLKYRDGLNPLSMGFPFVPNLLGKIIIKTFNSPLSEAKKCEQLIRGSSALVMFIAHKDEKHNWVNVGRSLQRVILKATSLGIKNAHINMPCEEFSVRNKLKKFLGLEEAQPILLLRIGYAKAMPGSFRKPIGEVLRNEYFNSNIKN